jgi:hypothetical protein
MTPLSNFSIVARRNKAADAERDFLVARQRATRDAADDLEDRRQKIETRQLALDHQAERLDEREAALARREVAAATVLREKRREAEVGGFAEAAETLRHDDEPVRRQTLDADELLLSARKRAAAAVIAAGEMCRAPAAAPLLPTDPTAAFIVLSAEIARGELVVDPPAPTSEVEIERAKIVAQFVELGRHRRGEDNKR